MLAMGGWFVKWYWEHQEIKHYADKMCKQAGLKIFVTSKDSILQISKVQVK